MAPRKSDMKSKMSNADEHTKRKANFLKLVAGFFFLIVVFEGGSFGGSGGLWSPWVTSGYGSTWLPLLAGLAAVASIGLFVSSLAGAVSRFHGAGTKALNVAGVALIALTISPSFTLTFWLVALGLVLGWIGEAIECDCGCRK